MADGRSRSRSSVIAQRCALGREPRALGRRRSRRDLSRLFYLHTLLNN